MDGNSPRKLSPAVTLGLLLLVTVLMSAFELMTKYGATIVLPADNFFKRIGFSAVASGWTWAGTAVAVLAFAIWLYVLRTVPLSLAYNFTTATFVVIPVGAYWFLEEAITVQKWVGYGLVIAGVLFLVPGLVKTESEVAEPVGAGAGEK